MAKNPLKKKTYDGIISSFLGVIKDLEDLENKKEKEIITAMSKVESLNIRMDAAGSEQRKAKATRDKLQEIFGTPGN